MKSLTLRSLKPYSGRVALYVLLVVLSVIFTMATALSVADFLRILFDQEQTSTPTVNLISQWLDGVYSWLIAFGRKKALILFSLIFFLLYSLKNIFTYLSAITIAIIRTLVVRDLRNSLFRKAMHLPVSYYDRTRKGDILARFGTDMVEYDETLLGSVQTLLTAVVSIVLYLAMLFYLNIKLTLFVLCMLPLVAVVISTLSHRLKRKSAEVQEMNADLISLTDETIGGLKIIKSYTAIDFVNSRFHHRNRKYSRRRTAMFRRIYSASPISDFLGNAIVVGIMLYGSLLVMSGDQGLTADLFVSYVMLFVLMIPPAKDLTTAYAQIKKGHACADRIAAFLDEDEENYISSPSPVAPPANAPTVELRDISFGYLPDKPVLHNLNLCIPQGSTVAIVGGSGSGKSTLVDLICHFYDPTSGTILFNGTPYSNIPLSNLRNRIGIVSQESLLFNDTVAANISFGSPNATDTDIEKAARAAQAHDFITALPQGYNTNIGDGGNALSGGQRQRLCIARALLRNPELLIFDEATSALDTESERMLQLTLDTLLRHHTAIVIAHRLSTVRDADIIVVLEQGRIVEQGTHSSLLSAGGRYAELVALQSLN